LARILRETFAEKRMTLPHRQVCEASREGTVNEAMALGTELSPSSSLKKKHRHTSAAIRWEIIADNLSKGRLKVLASETP
jgi:hypothetical protein